MSTSESQPPSSTTKIVESKHPDRCVYDFCKRFSITPKPHVALKIAMMRRNRRLAVIGIEDSSNSSCTGLDSDSKSDHECANTTSTLSGRTISNRETEGPHPRP
ncbi:hypothetical protein PIB30_081882, partial [Stylosanthes scabra]|nr:hypothetical protein [Stylosanthes scabra]